MSQIQDYSKQGKAQERNLTLFLESHKWFLTTFHLTLSLKCCQSNTRHLVKTLAEMTSPGTPCLPRESKSGFPVKQFLKKCWALWDSTCKTQEKEEGPSRRGQASQQAQYFQMTLKPGHGDGVGAPELSLVAGVVPCQVKTVRPFIPCCDVSLDAGTWRKLRWGTLPEGADHAHNTEGRLLLERTVHTIKQCTCEK